MFPPLASQLISLGGETDRRREEGMKGGRREYSRRGGRKGGKVRNTELNGKNDDTGEHHVVIYDAKLIIPTLQITS